MDITNTIRLYAECISGGAITEPTGGTWMSAICIWQGSTEPLNVSWLQRHCDNLGITQPLNGSWLIALANYYGETQPINGTWANAILVGCGAVPTDLIWNLTTTEWQSETAEWATAIAPPTPTFDQDGQTLTSQTPTLTGTSIPFCFITVTINGIDYKDQADLMGIWSLNVTDELPGGPGSGTQYPVSIICMDSSTGLLSVPFTGSVGILLTEKTITFELATKWSLYWYYAGMQVEQETTPGNWTAIEYEGNPTWNNGNTFYKVQPFVGGGVSAGYQTQNVMSFRTGDESGANSSGAVYRDIILDLGFNYRIVAVNQGTPNNSVNYGRFNTYRVYDEAIEILPEYDGADVDWLTGNIQQTFTL